MIKNAQLPKLLETQEWNRVYNKEEVELIEDLDKQLQERDDLSFIINGFVYELLFEMDLISMLTDAMKVELKNRICV